MSANLKEDTKGIFMSKFSNIKPQIGNYLNESCDYFLSQSKIKSNDYFVLDCSTIGDSSNYIQKVTENLGIHVIDKYQSPYSQRDAQHIDLLNFLPHQIRNYRVPILYFVDSFRSLRGNRLWKDCRDKFADLVVDRNANILLLQDI